MENRLELRGVTSFGDGGSVIFETDLGELKITISPREGDEVAISIPRDKTTMELLRAFFLFAAKEEEIYRQFEELTSI